MLKALNLRHRGVNIISCPSCARQQYDVIISEPSNPWIAGVAALFTREFFADPYPIYRRLR